MLLKPAPVAVNFAYEQKQVLESINFYALENELVIQTAINELVKDKTVIIVAHKLSTIKAAGQILVLDKGEIVQRGTHTELSKVSGGIYNDYRMRRQKARGWKITN